MKQLTANSPHEQWTWKVAQVAPVPLYHPLERTAISSMDSIDTISARISNFMKEHSIQSSYQDSRVTCSTDYCLHFAVQLWRKNNSIVIEVQRRQGCAIAMQALRQQLKNAILNDTKTTVPTPARTSERACAFLQQIPLAEQRKSEDCLNECLSICQQFLSSELLDQNRLGLESLVTMTDPSKVLPKDAQDTCQRMLQDSSMHSLLLKFFQADNGGHDERTHGTMHLLALKALSRALKEASSDVKIDIQCNFWQTVLQAFFKNVQFANEKPMEACLSIRSLRLLQALEPTLLQSQAMTRHLQVAHEYGRQYNQSLQKESELLMMKSSVY